MKYIQAVLSDEEYEEFVYMAKNLGLNIKDAVKESIKAWIEQRGKVFIRGVGEEVFSHPAFEEWHEFFIKEYKPPARKILLFHNCTWGKPYHEAWIFREMEKSVYEVLDPNEVHFVVLSSAGVIPREYWDYWPFCSYDSDPWQFTPEDRKAFIRINSKRVENYLSKHSESYKCMVAYFPLGDCARESVRIGLERSRCKLPFYEVPDIHPFEDRRDEDYYACLASEEALLQLKNILRKLND
ncbi:MAG: DUF5591 domain-containing protein [Candidatus Hydrothermarchaeota archaeon]